MLVKGAPGVTGSQWVNDAAAAFATVTYDLVKMLHEMDFEIFFYTSPFCLDLAAKMSP